MADPATLDWGAVTVDAYSKERRSALHTIAAEVSTVARAERVIRYCRGLQRWYQQHLPANTRQAFVFDLRGQTVAADARSRLLVFGQECPIQLLE